MNLTKNYISLAILIPAVTLIVAYLILTTYPAIQITGTMPESSSDIEEVKYTSAEDSDILFSRTLPKELKAGEKWIVTLDLSYDSPKNLEIYEKLPSGFKVINDGKPIENIESKKLENDVYLYKTIESTSNINLRYILEIPEGTTPGTYEISGWIEYEGKKQETPISRILIIK